MIELRHLFTMWTELGAPWEVGAGPLGRRRIFDVTGGRLEGRVSGRMLASGADSVLVDASGAARLDVRQLAELDDGSRLYIETRGRVVIGAEVMAAAPSRAALVAVDPARYHYRFTQTFETASKTYDWLNGVQAVGTGRFTDSGVAGDVFEIA